MSWRDWHWCAELDRLTDLYVFYLRTLQLRRLNETERQQAPLRQKNKQYLTRNIQLSVKNQQLTVTGKTMDHLSAGDATNLKRSLTRPNVNQLSKVILFYF